MLYYRANDYPGPLPAKLVAPDGTIFFPGIDGYDPNEILLAGYIPAPAAPVVQNYEILDWDSVNAVWVVTDPRTIESWKEYRIQEVSKYRRDKEETFVYGGTPINLTSETQARIDSAISGLERKPAGTTVWWQAGTVFTQFDLPGLEALGIAAFDHVEACFSNAKVLVETLQACTTIAELDAVNITVGWP
jgi:hypothetical protein